MTERKRLAFDTRAYKTSNGINTTAFAEGLASLAIEAGTNRPLHERINPHTLILTNDGKVINPQLGNKDIVEFYSTETDLDKKETQAGLVIRDVLLNEPPNTLVVWISPPGGPLNYQEGRFEIGVSKLSADLKILDCYGICNKFSGKGLLEIANQLTLFSQYKYNLDEIEDLRSNPIVIALGDNNAWDLLENIIPLSEVWGAIRENRALSSKNKAFNDSLKVAKLAKYCNDMNYISRGVFVERLMKDLGWELGVNACGSLNSEYNQIYQLSDLTIDTEYRLFDGNFSFGMVEKRLLQCTCPVCGIIVNAEVFCNTIFCPECKSYEFYEC